MRLKDRVAIITGGSNGLDVLFIGRIDPSTSVGLRGEIDNPVIKDAVQRIITESQAAGKAAGVGAINVGDPKSISDFIKQGAQFFSLNATAILRNNTANLLKAVKRDLDNPSGKRDS